MMLRLSATLACLTALAGCASTRAAGTAAVPSAATVAPADIDRLAGAPWIGTLTYLDYTSRVPTTIRSSLLITRLPPRPDGASAWQMSIGYADEPDANSGETAVLTRGGDVFRDAQVVERTVLPDGSVRVVTERDGEDDRRAARVRYVYVLGERACSVQKLVRFTPQEAFFERHIYRWSR